jgi:RNA-binding protein 39
MTTSQQEDQQPLYPQPQEFYQHQQQNAGYHAYVNQTDASNNADYSKGSEMNFERRSRSPRGRKRSRSRSRSRSYDRHRRHRKHRDRKRRRYLIFILYTNAQQNYDRSSSSERSSYERSRHRSPKRSSRNQYSTNTPSSNATPPQHEETEEQKIARLRRTVFVYHLATSVTEDYLIDFFNQNAGKVNSVRLIKDKFTGRSKGFGYVEFQEEESVKFALKLAGTQVQGHELMVKTSEAEKNIIHSAQTGGGAITRLYFKPVPDELNEDDMRMLFESVGPTDGVELRKNVHGQRLGYGYVKYKKPEDANKALLKIHNIRLGGIYVLKLGMWNEERVNPSITYQPILTTHSDKSAQQNEEDEALQNKYPGMELSSKLPPAGTPSQNITLNNMFDPKTETNPNFDQEIKQDVLDECKKFGKIVHIFVDKFSPEGRVYLRFDNIQSAQGAQQLMHGRWFARKMINCTFMTDSQYFSKFPELII